MNKKILATSFLFFSVTLPLKTLAADFSQIYVFGDSISDTGNVFTFTGGAIPPSPFYFAGRFSNGPNWIDYLSQDLGLNIPTYANVLGGAATTDGINFAFGGATTGTENTLSLTFPLPPLPGGGLQQQVGLFSNFAASANPDALYIVLAGANDYLPTEGTFTPFDQPNVPIANLTTAINSLANLGAENILLVNLPDLGKIPLTNKSPDATRLNNLTQAHNARLKNIRVSEVNLIQFNLNSLVDEVINDTLNNNSEKFGFTNVQDACLASLVPPVVCNTPDEYLFWDAQHPTTKAHRIIADRALDRLENQTVPEPASNWGILAFGFLGAGAIMKRQKDSNVKEKV